MIWQTLRWYGTIRRVPCVWSMINDGHGITIIFCKVMARVAVRLAWIHQVACTDTRRRHIMSRQPKGCTVSKIQAGPLSIFELAIRYAHRGTVRCLLQNHKPSWHQNRVDTQTNLRYTGFRFTASIATCKCNFSRYAFYKHAAVAHVHWPQLIENNRGIGPPNQRYDGQLVQDISIADRAKATCAQLPHRTQVHCTSIRVSVVRLENRLEHIGKNRVQQSYPSRREQNLRFPHRRRWTFVIRGYGIRGVSNCRMF